MEIYIIFILMMYLTTLLNSLINSKFFEFRILICLVICKTNFIYFFSVWMSFILFSYHIDLISSTNTILNRSSEREHCCTFLMLWKRHSNLESTKGHTFRHINIPSGNTWRNKAPWTRVNRYNKLQNPKHRLQKLHIWTSY